MRAIVITLALTFACAPLALAVAQCPTPTCPPANCQPDQDAYNLKFISQHYCIPECDILALREQGKSWSEINMMANAAWRTGQSITAIDSMLKQGTTYEQIAAKFNVPCADLMNPPPLRRMITSLTVAGAGPVAPLVIYDSVGNVLLTASQARRYYDMGFDWLDVAIAANVSKQTGYPIWQVLSTLRQRGMLWPDVVLYYGADPCTAFDICDYPFEHKTIYSQRTTDQITQKLSDYARCCRKMRYLPPTLIGKNPWSWMGPGY